MGDEKPVETPTAAEPWPERRDDEPVAVVAPLRRGRREPAAAEPPDGGDPPDAA